MKLFEIEPLAAEVMSFIGLSIFSTSGRFVLSRGTVLAIFVDGHKRKICLKTI